MVRGEDGRPLPRSYVVYRRMFDRKLDAIPGYEHPAPKTGWMLTGDDGAFRFQVPVEGEYRVCTRQYDLELLNPCLWETAPPAVQVGAARRAAAVDLRVARGRLLKVKVKDPEKILPRRELPAAAPGRAAEGQGRGAGEPGAGGQANSSQPGPQSNSGQPNPGQPSAGQPGTVQPNGAAAQPAQIRVGLWTERGFFFPFEEGLETETEKEYYLAVPFDTQFEFEIAASNADLEDKAGRKLPQARSRTQLTARRGQQVEEVEVTVRSTAAAP